jgi:hypothetical protein
LKAGRIWSIRFATVFGGDSALIVIIEAMIRRAIRRCQRAGFSMDEIDAGIAKARASPEQQERRGPKVKDDDGMLCEMRLMISHGFRRFTAAKQCARDAGTPDHQVKKTAHRLCRKFPEYMSRVPGFRPRLVFGTLITVWINFPVNLEFGEPRTRQG